MDKQTKKKQPYVAPWCEYFKVEIANFLCNGSVQHNATHGSEEEWADGGKVIEETIEV